MQTTTTRPKITATADGEGVVSHAGPRLLADVADRTTLTGQLAEALAGVRRPRARHDAGRIVVDMAPSSRARSVNRAVPDCLISPLMHQLHDGTSAETMTSWLTHELETHVVLPADGRREAVLVDTLINWWRTTVHTAG